MAKLKTHPPRTAPIFQQPISRPESLTVFNGSLPPLETDTNNLSKPTRILEPIARLFHSDATLEAISKASQENTTTLVLYNYPYFSRAFSTLFAHVFHFRLNVPSLIFPFSSVEPFRVEDLKIEGLEKCYLLDFVGPKGFAQMVSRQYLCQ